MILGDADNTSPAGHRLTAESDTGAAPAILSRPRVGKTHYGYQRMALYRCQKCLDGPYMVPVRTTHTGPKVHCAILKLDQLLGVQLRGCSTPTQTPQEIARTI